VHQVGNQYIVIMAHVVPSLYPILDNEFLLET